MRLSPEQIAQIRQSGALRFAPERFRAEFTAFVEREWAAFRGDHVADALRPGRG